MKAKGIFYRSKFVMCGLLVLSSSLENAAEVYKVDPVHSAISFRIKHLGISYVLGRFNNGSGNYEK